MIDSIKVNYKDGTSQIVKLPEKDNYVHAYECNCTNCFKNKVLLQWNKIEDSDIHNEDKLHELGSFVFDLI